MVLTFTYGPCSRPALQVEQPTPLAEKARVGVCRVPSSKPDLCVHAVHTAVQGCLEPPLVTLPPKLVAALAPGTCLHLQEAFWGVDRKSVRPIEQFGEN